MQDYNWDKWAENFYKTIKNKTIKNKKSAEISAIEPLAYCNRYINFMKEEVFISKKKTGTIA